MVVVGNNVTVLPGLLNGPNFVTTLDDQRAGLGLDRAGWVGWVGRSAAELAVSNRRHDRERNAMWLLGARSVRKDSKKEGRNGRRKSEGEMSVDVPEVYQDINQIMSTRNLMDDPRLFIRHFSIGIY